MVCILNLIGMIGFSILNCIVGGQALASVANGNLSWRYIRILFPGIECLTQPQRWDHHNCNDISSGIVLRIDSSKLVMLKML